MTSGKGPLAGVRVVELAGIDPDELPPQLEVGSSPTIRGLPPDRRARLR